MASKTTEFSPKRANKLYWNSDKTVDQVAEEAGLSRHALYAVVEPLPAGVACTACGGQLEYANRSSRAAGLAVCAECGNEQNSATAAAWEPADTLDLPTEPETVAEVITAPPRTAAGQTTLNRLREDIKEVPPQRIALVGGAAVLGVALGAAATQLIRDR